MSRLTTPATVARKLHAIELDTLRQVVEQQHAELVELRQRVEQQLDALIDAERAADSWRDNALRLMEDACADGTRAPGITQDGTLVLVGGAA